jgi:hypothetical protein
MTVIENETRDFSTSESVEIERERLQDLLMAGKLRPHEYTRQIISVVAQWKAANYPPRRKRMKMPAPRPAEIPFAERRAAELPGIIDDLSTQLAAFDRRRTKLLEDLRLELNALEARLNTALAELGALRSK